MPLGHQAQRLHHPRVQQAKVARIAWHLDTRVPVQQAIEDARQAPLQRGLVAARAPHGVDHVVALPPASEHLGQQRRGVLAVGIHQKDDVAARTVQPGGQGRLFAEIARQIDQHQLRVRGAQLGRHGRGGIAAAVVDHDQLDMGRKLGQRGQHLRHDAWQGGGLVEGRHDAGDAGNRLGALVHGAGSCPK